jgi:hypothetical protein
MSTLSIHLDRLLEPLADGLSRDVAAKVANLRADEALQTRVGYLADRAKEVIAVLQARARSRLRGQP